MINREQFKTLKVFDGKEYVELEEVLKYFGTEYEAFQKSLRDIQKSVLENLAGLQQVKEVSGELQELAKNL